MEITKWTPECGIPLYQYVKDRYRKNKYFTIENETQGKIIKAKIRLFENNKQVYQMLPKSKKYGKKLEQNNIISVYQNEPKEKNPEIEFNKRCSKIITMLSQYQLWEDLKTTIEIWQILGYKTNKYYQNNHFDIPYRITWGTTQENQKEYDRLFEQAKSEVQKILSALHLKKHQEFFMKKLSVIHKDTVTRSPYPAFYKHVNEPAYNNLNRFFQSEWFLIDSKIKKMTFHKGKEYKGITESILEEIKASMKNKIPYSVKGKNGYDVSFQYDPKSQKAWYSEEYKNCGNGHYYLALNDRYAIFYEDD